MKKTLGEDHTIINDVELFNKFKDAAKLSGGYMIYPSDLPVILHAFKLGLEYAQQQEALNQIDEVYNDVVNGIMDYATQSSSAHLNYMSDAYEGDVTVPYEDQVCHVCRYPRHSCICGEPDETTHWDGDSSHQE